MSTYKNRTTPGVYVTELNAFPRSVPGVETAIPAFIGYTEKAVLGGRPALFTPIPINSMADYEEIFGGDFTPVYDINEAPEPATADFVAHKKDENGNFLPFYYVLNRTSAVPNNLMSFSDDEDDRPYQDGDEDDAKVRATMGTFLLYNSMRLFYANGGGTCYVVSVGSYITADDPPALTRIALEDLKNGLTAVREQVGPTMLVIPDAVSFATTPYTGGETPAPPPFSTDFNTICDEMLKQCHDLQDRVAILDVWGTDQIDPISLGKATFDKDINDRISSFRGGIKDNLNYGMAYFPFLVTSVVPADEVNFTSFNLASQLSKLSEVLTDEVEYLYQGEAGASTRKSVGNEIKKITATDKASDPAIGKLNQNLVNAIPLLQQIYDTMAAKMSLLPPSGAIAGVYTSNDANRGVWNAPANITLKSVIEPSVKINADLQGPLNSPIDGKSVNVIRDFVGRGPVVWGARTLDGNSNDWRYIQVRRAMVYIEQSIKTALNQFVFAPNNGSTWVAVTAMVSGFLQNLWSQSGLMGDKASDAFTVRCGLNSTMTGMDILQGYMVVQVTLQMIHPAEFIELTFKQKMEGVG